MKPHEEHRRHAEGRLRVRIVTVSSSRYQKKEDGKEFDDEGGDTAQHEIEAAGHLVTGRRLISDDVRMLRKEVRGIIAGKDDVLLFTGGTGISSRDLTLEAVRPFFEKELVGFGELFRRLSYDEVGSASILSRATLGVVKGKLVMCLPGSPGAVRTALRATARELSHASYIART
jgi:molybdopterin adenylyltransferase